MGYVFTPADKDKLAAFLAWYQEADTEGTPEDVVTQYVKEKGDNL